MIPLTLLTLFLCSGIWPLTCQDSLPRYQGAHYLKIVILRISLFEGCAVLWNGLKARTNIWGDVSLASSLWLCLRSELAIMSCPSVLSHVNEQKALINPLLPPVPPLQSGHPQTSFPLSNLKAYNPVEPVPTSLTPSSRVAVQLNKFKELD